MFSKLRGWLFKERRDPDRAPLDRARPKLNMASFTLQIPDEVMECEVNLDALAVRDRAATPWFWTIRMRARDVDDRGLPTANEQLVLDRMLDHMLDDLCASHEVMVIGRNTVAGQHEVWIYSSVMAGGTIAGMKGAYWEEEDRLQNFTGREDPTWALVESYLQEVPVGLGGPGRGSASGEHSN